MAVTPADPRVLFVSSHALLGGSERHLQRLLARLPVHQVAGVVSLQQGPLVAELADWPVEVIPTGPGPAAVLHAAWRLRRHIRRWTNRPDVIHANGVKAALVAVLAAGPTVPVVWNKHDHAFDGPRGRWIAARCAAVVGVSESAVHAVRPSARAVRVLPPLLDVPVADAERGRQALRELAGTGEEPVLLSVGRLDRAKGHADLLQALALVRKRRPVTAVVIGATEPTQPEYPQQLRDHTARLGLADAVVLAGFRDDAVDLMAAAAAVVITSHAVRRDGMGAEGFGLVAVEAMAAGVPVVAYADGAIPELLGDCGVLVPPRDIKALAAAIDGLLADPGRARDVVECGLRRAAELRQGTGTESGLREVYQTVSTGRRSIPTA